MNTLYIGELAELLDAIILKAPLSSRKGLYIKEEKRLAQDFNTKIHLRLEASQVEYGDFAGGKPVVAYAYENGVVHKFILNMIKITTSRPVETYYGIGGGKVGYSTPAVGSAELETTAIYIPLTQSEKFMCDVHNIKYPD